MFKMGEQARPHDINLEIRVSKYTSIYFTNYKFCIIRIIHLIWENNKRKYNQSDE